MYSSVLFGSFFFKFYFIFKLYITVLVLPNIKMNPPQVYMCSPSWALIPPPSPFHPSGSSQGTSPKHPVSDFTDLRALSQRLPLLQTLALLLSLPPTAPHAWRPRAGLNCSSPFSTICLRITVLNHRVLMTICCHLGLISPKMQSQVQQGGQELPENSLLFYCWALDALCNRLLCHSSGLCLYAVFHVIQTFLKGPHLWNKALKRKGIHNPGTT